MIQSIKVNRKGEGIGRQVVRELEALLKKKNVAAIKGYAVEKSHGFWHKMGYEFFPLSDRFEKRLT